VSLSDKHRAMLELPASEPRVLEQLDEAERLLRILQRDLRLNTRQRGETRQIEAKLSTLWQYWLSNEHGPYSGTLEAHEAQQEIGRDALRLTQRLAKLWQEAEGRV